MTIKITVIIIGIRGDDGVGLDYKARVEIDRDQKILHGADITEVYGNGTDMMILGVIVEAMVSAGYRKSRIVDVLHEAAEAMDELPAKEFRQILNEFLAGRYKKSRREQR